jgi:hypothetical protein
MRASPVLGRVEAPSWMTAEQFLRPLCSACSCLPLAWASFDGSAGGTRIYAPLRLREASRGAVAASTIEAARVPSHSPSR